MHVRATFPVGIAFPACEQGRIVTERVASTEQTHFLHEDRQVSKDRKKKAQYREAFLHRLCIAVGTQSGADELVNTFVRMADALHAAKALALPLVNEETVSDEAERGHVETAQCNLLDRMSLEKGLLNPLSIALLAFRMGGGLNAANSMHAREWASQGTTEAGIPDFYQEGDSGDVFEDYRLSLVWEARGTRLAHPSGNHTVFLRGTDVPQPLAILSKTSQDGHMGPIAIMYRSRDTALWYDCLDKAAIRRSISLDFHVNTMSEQDINLLSAPSSGSDQVGITLPNLITQYPRKDYENVFHSLLFADDSIRSMLDTLGCLTVPNLPSQTSCSPADVLQHRFHAWRRENCDSIPRALRTRPMSSISGIYEGLRDFVESVARNAQQDVHLEAGTDMLPQSPSHREREYARKFIRDQPEASIRRKLLNYGQHLLMPYSDADLIPTDLLSTIGRSVKTRCFELTGAGYIDSSFLLPAMGALSGFLGDALDRAIEGDVKREPSVTDTDLAIFRVKSLYLFWTADWLARYLGNPEQGSMMIMRIDDGSIQRMKEGAVQRAGVLLRNWVAWSLFVEKLPKGGFVVRKATDLTG